jgi:hypothetical protein
LIGLTLVILQAALGAVGLIDIHNAALQDDYFNPNPNCHAPAERGRAARNDQYLRTARCQPDARTGGSLRHAQANRITLKLQSEDRHTLLEVNDDGRGFDPQQAQRGLGLASMAERARVIQATFEVTSRPGEGTRVRVIVSPF